MSQQNTSILRNIISFFLSYPEDLVSDKLRVYYVSKFSYLISMKVHTGYAVFFSIAGFFPLAIYNLASIMLFVFLIVIANERLWFTAGLFLTIAEYITHATFTSFAFGIEPGFQYSLFGVAAYVPFIDTIKLRWRIGLVLLALGSLCAIIILNWRTIGLMPMNEEIIRFLLPVNIVLNFSGVALASLYFTLAVKTAETRLEKSLKTSDALLANILPPPIAKRMKSGEKNIVNKVENGGVLFVDIVGFTQWSAKKDPTEVIKYLNRFFRLLDKGVKAYGLEKIKTIGDSYMVASGLFTNTANHLADLVHFAYSVMKNIKRVRNKKNFPFECRIGIDTGPIVAGVIGERKFAYDIWGDTVNTASRMESACISGQVRVTQRVYVRTSQWFKYSEEEFLDIKGKGKMRTFLLLGKSDTVPAT